MKHTSVTEPDPAHVAGGVPGCLFPFGIFPLPEADFIQLSKQGMRNVFLITVFCP